MRRATTALVALLAVLALGAAAGGFDAPDGPDVEGDWQPTTFTEAPSPEGVPPEQPVRTKDAPPTPTGEESGSYVASEPAGTVASGSGGVSPLFVAVFVGGLLASGLVALALTGDDERASEPESGDGSPEDPRPTVEVRYGSPPDGPVVGAWRRLTEAVGADATETPRETARRAADAGFSRRASRLLADQFSAVRYGGGAANDEREREIRDAVAELDELDADDG